MFEAILGLIVRFLCEPPMSNCVFEVAYLFRVRSLISAVFSALPVYKKFRVPLSWGGNTSLSKSTIGASPISFSMILNAP